MLISSKVSFVQLSLVIDGVVMQEMVSEDNWTTPIVSYLRDDILPDGKETVRKFKVQVARLVLIKDILYKREFSRPYLKCLTTEEAEYVMGEVHEGVCRNHLGS